jgi:hypothetical protein
MAKQNEKHGGRQGGLDKKLYFPALVFEMLSSSLEKCNRLLHL